MEYWENFASHAFENTTQSVYSHCVLLKPNGAPVPSTFCFSIRRDLFDLPSVVIGALSFSLFNFATNSAPQANGCRSYSACILSVSVLFLFCGPITLQCGYIHWHWHTYTFSHPPVAVIVAVCLWFLTPLPVRKYFCIALNKFVLSETSGAE